MKFEFKAINNQVEYETLINDMVFTLEMGVSKLKVKSDSHQVANKCARGYQDKEPQFIRYHYKVQNLSTHFKSFDVEYVLREQNFRAYLMSNLVSLKET